MCKKLQKDLLYFYEKIVFPVAKKYDCDAFDIFEKGVFEFDKYFDFLEVDKPILQMLKKEISKKIELKQSKIRAIFSVQCFTERGILDIQEALRVGESLSTKEIPLEIILIGSPVYQITTRSHDKEKATKIMREALNKISQFIENKGGSYELNQCLQDDKKENQFLKMM